MPYKRDVFVFNDRAQATDFVIKVWRAIAESSTKERGFFTVALSGGRAPVDLYRKLAGIDELPWQKTHIFMVDERFVPWTHPDSNYGMLRREMLNPLLSQSQISEENIHPIPVPVGEKTAEKIAKKYEIQIKNFFRGVCKNSEKEPPGFRNKFPVFDLIILGLGEDGHTASLFPQSPALDEKKRLAVEVSRAGLKHERITLTLSVLNSARNVVFLIAGKNKAGVVKKILGGKKILGSKNNIFLAVLPAARVNPYRGKLIFALDKDAISLLGSR